MSLADQRLLRLGTLCLLYVAQGIPWGFTATTIPAYLAERDAAVGGALAMTTLPYSFKWIWGPLMDAFTIPRLGRRRPWIVFAQLMMAATILAMISISDITTDLKLLAWMIFVHTIFNSMQDVAVDALAVDLLEEKERGRANGMMYASKYLGGFIGGAGIATVIEYFGFGAALYVQTLLLVAIMLLPFLLREGAAPTAWVRTRTLDTVREVGRGLVEAFSIRSAIVAILLVIALNFAYAVLYANAFALYTGKLHWTAADYARLTGGYGLLIGFVGAITSGFLSDTFGRRAVAAGGSFALVVSWVAFALLQDYWHVTAFVIAFATVQAFALAVMTVALIALCMDLSSPRVGASQFSAYMAMQSVATTIGYQLAAPVSEHLDFDEMYLVGAAVQVVVTGLLVFVDPGETRAKLPRPPAAPTSITGIVAVTSLFIALTAMTVWTLVRTLG